MSRRISVVTSQLSAVALVLLLIPGVGRVVFCVMTFYVEDAATSEIYTLSLHVALPISFRSAELLTMFMPSDQLYETPPVALRLIVVTSQLSSVAPVLLVIPGVGRVVFCVMTTDVVSEHPLSAVTLTL